MDATVSIERVFTPVGTLTVIAGDAGVQRVLWDGEELPEAVGANAEVSGGAGAGAAAAAIAGRAAAQIREYFAGQRTEFDLPLDLGGTAFQQEAWLALASIPYGGTISYAEQARRIGRSGAARAVGSANSRNPVPILLPCHRVVGANGALTGFGGGLDVKAALLGHETRVLGDSG